MQETKEAETNAAVEGEESKEGAGNDAGDDDAQATNAELLNGKIIQKLRMLLRTQLRNQRLIYRQNATDSLHCRRTIQ